jgi:hypothetical protein
VKVLKIDDIPVGYIEKRVFKVDENKLYFLKGIDLAFNIFQLIS